MLSKVHGILCLWAMICRPNVNSLRGAHPSTNTSLSIGRTGNFMEDKYQGEPLPQPLDNKQGEKWPTANSLVTPTDIFAYLLITRILLAEISPLQIYTDDFWKIAILVLPFLTLSVQVFVYCKSHYRISTGFKTYHRKIKTAVLLSLTQSVQTLGRFNSYC